MLSKFGTVARNSVQEGFQTAAKKVILLSMKHLIFIALQLFTNSAFAQMSGPLGNRVDLDDVSIKGEANKGSVSFGNRSRHSLNDRIKIRKDFNKEVLENLPADFNTKKAGP